MVDTDDAAVVARCLAGEHNAYEAIVSRYQKGLFNVALRMLGNYEDARDATQTAFIKAYEHLDSFNPEQRFFNWLFRILKNECLNSLRGRRAAEPVSVGLAGEPGGFLELEVRNRTGVSVGGGSPGVGLTGMTERAELAGGVLTYGGQPDGSFLVRARLPWVL